MLRLGSDAVELGDGQRLCLKYSRARCRQSMTPSTQQQQLSVVTQLMPVVGWVSGFRPASAGRRTELYSVRSVSLVNANLTDPSLCGLTSWFSMSTPWMRPSSWGRTEVGIITPLTHAGQPQTERYYFRIRVDRGLGTVRESERFQKRLDSPSQPCQAEFGSPAGAPPFL
jgi:hypothetical protein